MCQCSCFLLTFWIHWIPEMKLEMTRSRLWSQPVISFQKYNCGPSREIYTLTVRKRTKLQEQQCESNCSVTQDSLSFLSNQQHCWLFSSDTQPFCSLQTGFTGESNSLRRFTLWKLTMNSSLFYEGWMLPFDTSSGLTSFPSATLLYDTLAVRTRLSGLKSRCKRVRT